jgi:hypothetical protein
MPNYLSPGVYIQELDTGVRPIESVSTTTAAFVGVAPNPKAHMNEATAVMNWPQFVREFVPPDLPEGSPPNSLANAVYGFFNNGGARLYVVNTGGGGAIAGGGRGLDQLTAIDEIAMVAAPGATDPVSYEALLSFAELRGDVFAILDGPERVDDVEQLTRVAEIEPAGPGDAPAKGAKPKDGGGGKPAKGARDSKMGAMYYPWIRVRDAIDPDRITTVPPSGHMAGIYARTDTERGVFKAPANTVVRGALGTSHRLTKAEQGVLNPVGVNCIRLIAGAVNVWGARTKSIKDPQWRYVNVRRLFLMVEKSIERGTNWAVFEPNHLPLWKAIRVDASLYLTLLWRQGALMGAAPEQAFFVKCDEETNTPEVIDAGQLVVEIGLAAVRPAEFVVFRIGQSEAGATVEAL